MLRLLTFLLGLLLAVNSAQAATLTADLFAASTGCDATSGNQSDTLPAATGTGRMMVYQKIDATANTCTLTLAGSDTIQGATSVTLTTQWQAYVLQDRASGSWRVLTLPGLLQSGANAIAGTIKDNLGLPRDLVKDFGAACDGSTDDAAAFTAATTWMATAPAQRLVTIPAGSACLTSVSVVIGNGRAQSTTLTVAASGTSWSVASCTGVVAGDAVAVRRDDGTVFQSVTVSSCTSTTMVVSGAYSGTTASSGNAVFTGKASTYVGGGFVGYGAAVTGSPVPAASTIKAHSTFPTSLSTTLSGTAAAAATSIIVTSATGIALGTPIGVTLDDGSVWWTWARQSPSGTTVHLGAWIPSTATSGNAVVVANNPLLKVAGPHYFAKLSGLYLDGSSRAAIGLEMIGPTGAKVDGPRGVTALSYTGIGHYIHASEFNPGQSGSVADNDFELNAQSPSNANTIGCFYRGSAFMKNGFSRSRFHGGNCMAGGASAKAAAIVMEHLDNNTFESKIYGHDSGVGAGLGASMERRASPYQTGNFPTDNVFVAPVFLDAVTNTTSNGQVTGLDYVTGLAVGDGGPYPPSNGVSGLVGVTDTGRQFGQFLTPNAYPGLTITRTGNATIAIAQGSALDSTNTVVMYNNACTASLAASGVDGLDSGSVRAADTWYSAFLITANGLNALCILHQTTPAVIGAPVLPTGYTHYAYVGRMRTDGSQNFRADTLLPPGQFWIDVSDTWTPGEAGLGFRPRAARLVACGPGGSGGGGARQVSGTGVSGGGGGSGGGCMDITYPYETLASSISITVGTAGAGGTPAAGDNTAGSAGSAASGPTFFGAAANTAIAYGGQGCAGSGGQLNASSASGGAGIGLVSLNTITACTAASGSTIGTATTGGTNGVVGAAGTIIATPSIGGVGGGGTITTAPVGSYALGRFSCTGGGAGGAVTAAGPTSVNGGAGGLAGDSGNASSAGGSSGTPTGTAGAADMIFAPGGGGGGGYGNSAGTGGTGGAGARCSGGGGGGSVLNGSTAGTGGTGGDGFAMIWLQR